MSSGVMGEVGHVNLQGRLFRLRGGDTAQGPRADAAGRAQEQLAGEGEEGCESCSLKSQQAL